MVQIGKCQNNMKKAIYILFLIPLMFFTCKQDKDTPTGTKPAEYKIHIPDFNADSAFAYIEKQVAFGPRVPNSEAHAQCAAYLANKMKSYTDEVIVQEFQARAYNGEILNGKNIIASFLPEKSSRIFLCAHWDSRPYADHDENPQLQNTPIDGANDGASGVGVLIEIARQLHINQPNIGIDILFFDAEDYGEPKSTQSNKEDTWGLGSQYWSRNPHRINYRARFGILLDMVGAKDATFTKEGYSMEYASDIVNKVWDIAKKIGYQKYFIDKKTGYITDDHYYVNKIARIPTIDVIHIDPKTYTFFEHWHTINDTMENIDKETLKAVGETVITVVFLEK